MAHAGDAGGPGIYRERRVYEGPGTDVEQVERVDQVTETRYTSGYLLARRIIYFVLGVIEFLLLFRFVLKLFGANPASPFAAFIYAITEVFVYPFTGLFADVAAGRSLFEPRTLVAMAVFAVIAWGIDRLVRIIMRGTEPVA